jgi:hypothetical protein
MVEAFAYLDDSGTHPTSAVRVIGGFVATKDVWQELEPKWSAILDPFRERGVDCFHATDCLNHRKKYQAILDVECRRIYREAADLLSGANIYAMWASVREADWATVANANSEFGGLAPSAYDFCIDRVVSDVVNWALRFAEGTPVGVVIADQEEHQSETERTIMSWRRHARIEELIGTVGFASPKKMIPLQTADMMAHEAFRHGRWVDAVEHCQPEPTEGLHPKVLPKITSVNGLRHTHGHMALDFLRQFAGEIRSA